MSQSQIEPIEQQHDESYTWSDFARRAVDGDSVAELFGVDDDFVDFVLAKAYQLYSRRNFNKAEALVRGAVSLDPTRADVHVLLGDILLQTGRARESAIHLKKALEIDGEEAFVVGKLGEALMRLGDPSAASAVLSRSLELMDAGHSHYRRLETLLRVVKQSGAVAAEG